jgi:type I restriction enzyme S subunit
VKFPSAPLGEIVEIPRDAVAPDAITSGTTYVGLENITGDGEFFSVRTVEAGDLASTKFRFSNRHILYGKLRPYLRKIARPDFNGICSTDILPILPGERVDRDYLCHFLRLDTAVAFAESRSVGVNLPRISPGVLSTLQVPLPPIEEQRRIATILDKADALRQKRRTALQKLDSLTQSIFIDMFGEPAINSKKWPRTLLGELLKSGPQNGLYKPAEAYGEGTPILRIDAFYDGEVTDYSALRRLRLTPDEITLYKLEENDLVVNRVNSMEYLGKSALITNLHENTVFESNMMRFSVDREVMDPHYLIAFLQTSYIKAQILQRSKNAVNQSSINQEDVKSFTILQSPLSLQKTFAERVLRAKRYIKMQMQAGQQYDSLFKSLQSRAFHGEL